MCTLKLNLMKYFFASCIILLGLSSFVTSLTLTRLTVQSHRDLALQMIASSESSVLYYGTRLFIEDLSIARMTRKAGGGFLIFPLDTDVLSSTVLVIIDTTIPTKKLQSHIGICFTGPSSWNSSVSDKRRDRRFIGIREDDFHKIKAAVMARELIRECSWHYYDIRYKALSVDAKKDSAYHQEYLAIKGILSPTDQEYWVNNVLIQKKEFPNCPRREQLVEQNTWIGSMISSIGASTVSEYIDVFAVKTYGYRTVNTPGYNEIPDPGLYD